jgi:heme exporter protein A
MLTLDNLTLFKDDKKIFSSLNFSISTSSALIIRGENGSGKTSLLKILATISKPTSGNIFFADHNILDIIDDYRSDIQFIGHKNFLKKELTVRENIKFFADLNQTSEAIDSAINFFALTNYQHQKISKLSAGWQKKVMLAKLLSCIATIWILDEPSNNLDFESRKKLRGLIETRIKDDGLVIISTHDEMFFDLGANLFLKDFQ